MKILDENSVVLPKNKALFCYYDENGNQKTRSQPLWAGSPLNSQPSILNYFFTGSE